MDVDIGRDFHVAGSDPIKVHDELIRAGFMEVPSLNHRHPASSFALKKPRVKIDFLTPKKGKGKEAPVKLGGMGVHADELRFLESHRSTGTDCRTDQIWRLGQCTCLPVMHSTN